MKTLDELFSFLQRYGLKPNDLARICEINPSLMRQYALGIKKPGEKNLFKINEKICIFAEELKEFKISDA